MLSRDSGKAVNSKLLFLCMGMACCLLEIVSLGQICVIAAVVGAADDFKGQVPIACVVLNDAGTGREEELRAEINSAVRTEVSPVAALAGICAPHCCLDCVYRLLG